MMPMSRRPRAVLAALATGATITAFLTTPFTTPAAVADPLAAPTVSETFDGTTLPAGWTPVDGTWKVHGGRLVGTSASSSQQSRITFGSPLTDFRIESHLRFESALDGARWVAFGLDLAPSGAGNNSAEPLTITLDGVAIVNGSIVDTTALAAGKHTVKAAVAGSTVESSFDVLATPTGLASLILTSAATPSTVSTMTTLLGQKQYAVLAT
jgi:hypothetical protein